MVVCRGRRFLADISPAVYDRILREAHWLALADELRDNGHDDLALVVRGYYPAFGEAVAGGKTPEQMLRFFTRRGIRWLARRIREGQERDRRQIEKASNVVIGSHSTSRLLRPESPRAGQGRGVFGWP
jgi:hypothetical protein